MSIKNDGLFLVMIFATMLLLNGCRRIVSEVPEPLKEGDMSISISSPAFNEEGVIPKKYTCDAENLSPVLNWSGVPQGAKSLALIVDDPDAPVGIFVHWVIYGMAANLNGLPEGVTKSDSVSGIGIQGVNDFRKKGYDGPCPPKGSNHRYYFKLYALDTVLDLKAGAKKADVERAMQGHILAQGQLMGRYSR